MSTKTNIHTKQTFISLFNSIARHKHRYSVFSDFVTMSAIALHNAVNMNEALEKEYLEIVARYSKEDVNSFCELLGNFVILMEPEPADILGSLYMELEINNLNNGQFFTPHEISLLLAKLTYGDMLDNLANKPFVTLSEPACGAGGMILAFTNEMLKKGINPAEKLCVQCIDIDRLAGLMCYLQLSLWHVPAEVIIGNTLTLEFREVYYTPSYYLGDWKNRLSIRNLTKAISSLCESIEEPKTEKPTVDIAQHEIVDQKPVIIESLTATIEIDVLPVEPVADFKKTNKKKGGSNNSLQVDLFDFVIDR